MKGRPTETEILSPVTLLMDVKVVGLAMSVFIGLQLCNSQNNGKRGKIFLSLLLAFSQVKFIMVHWHDKKSKDF